MNQERKQIADLESALEAQLAELQKQRGTLDSELQRVSKKLDLLRQIHALDSVPGQASVVAPNQTSDGRASPAAVRDAAKKILTESKTPLHINEIHRQFLKRGYPIPGKGTAFNILAHLVNNKDLVRVARGTYALAGTVPQEQVLQKAPRKRRRANRRRNRELSQAKTGL